MTSQLPVSNQYINFTINDGILYGTFNEKVVIDLRAAQTIFNDRISNYGEFKYPTLVDSRGVTSFTKEARDFLSSEEARRGIKATAILVSGYLSSTIANFFLKVTIKEPQVPTKIFSDRQKAIIWLEQYK